MTVARGALPGVPVEPFVRGHRHRGQRQGHSLVDAVGALGQKSVCGPQEPGLDEAVEQIEEGTEEAVDIQKHHRFGLETELVPGEHLDEFVESSKSSGHGDETAREVCHTRFSFMHRRDHFEPSETAMGHLGALEMFRNDSDDFTAGIQCGIGDDPHQPDVATAVDELESTIRQCSTQSHRRLGRARMGPGIGAAVHTHGERGRDGHGERLAHDADSAATDR